MSMLKRIQHIFTGLFMLICCIILIIFPKDGPIIAASFLGFILICYGLGYLWYYIRMARHMVGGKAMLFRGIIALDLGAFTYSLVDIPKIYMMFYLLTVYGMQGLIRLLRGLEARSLESPSWRRNVVSGIGSIAIAVYCIFFVRSSRVLVNVCCIGLIYSACLRISLAFRRTPMVYVQ